MPCTEPTSLTIGIVGTGSVDQGERLFYKCPFPVVGLTIGLTVTSGRVVCYISHRYRNPTSTQGYDWRIESDGYKDVYIDPELLNRDPGQNVYIAVEGLESNCDFSLNTTEGDRRGSQLLNNTTLIRKVCSFPYSTICGHPRSICHRNTCLQRSCILPISISKYWTDICAGGIRGFSNMLCF